jgi:phenylacetate-CoA ligase
LPYIVHTIGAYLRRNIIFPFYWKYIKHSNVLSCHKALRNHQWNTLEENKKIQQKKLYSLITYASQNTPYYQGIIKEHNIQFSENTIFDDIKKFPILTKEIIRNNFDELYKFRDNTYYRNTSGGSTGEPVVFYQDAQYFGWATANKTLFNEWAGRKLGEPMVKLWGSLQDILRGGQSFKGYLRQQLSGVTILNSDRMTEKNMYAYVRRINHIKPCLLLAFTNSIDELTRFIQRNHLSIYAPNTIMTTAGVLYPEVRKRIEEVFHAPVFNCYGSQEVSDIACNCEKDQGLHLIPDIHYLEIVDEKGKEVKPGKEGNIVITLLTNYTMPLIRYKIGDRGILSEKKCSCGRGLPLLKKVIGRIRANFKNKFGDYINGGVFIDLFYFQENIKQFQIIQETVDFIIINLVLIDKINLKDMDKDFKEINKKICKIMMHKTNVNYNIVDEIEPSPSGKYMYAFSRVKERERT